MKMYYYFVVLLIFLLGAYIFIEPRFLSTEKVSLEIGKIEGTRIVHLSDFHSSHFGRTEKKVLSRLNKLQPDYVFITGDFIDTRTRNLKSCREFWEALVAQHPGKVYGVLGNHEYRHSQTEEIKRNLEQSGIKLLNNETVQLEGFTLGGVKSPHLQHDEVEALGREVDILLAHSPEIFKKVKNKDIDLVLTGHTHGGQISIPLLRRLVLPLRYGRKYREGLFQEQGTYLYVNRGIGTTILPIRFNAPPEITSIEFK